MKTADRRRKAGSGNRGKAEAGGKRVTLPRALSKLGYCSRTQAEALIREGRVSVAGKLATDTEAWVDLDRDRITVDGKPVSAEKSVYLMLNKPRGLVTTRHDPEGRATVYDCLKDFSNQHISPVGRLDKASEGLLLFTNDTAFADNLMDPETHVGKTYHVQIDKVADAGLVASMLAGIDDKGDHLRARKVSILREGDKNSWLEIELDQGKNRQIRRMLEAHDITVLRLIRVSIGNLQLGDLAKGEVRALTARELSDLRRLAGK